ncbi:hypothetical protein [Hymenobacter lapidiphilus]|uniref:Uncharacterized protein n=1 Tax=Hymenobacter lapidiphilus TaxID=2608003 RepID=A0A7Y7U873_9BACT|nr:hypothetical protein [Hymenobacter lapidiphilus]NVO33270.1 hypothetical protein [Hymenobacter lapidiphilus]
MAAGNKKVAAAGAAATKGVRAVLEPGLPFVGELLFPIARHKELNKLLHWTVADNMMGAAFPIGTVLGVKEVTSRAAITVGRVYVWEYRGSVTLLRITGLRKRGIQAQWDRYQGRLDTRTRLHWKDESFALYEVACYITYGARKQQPLANPTYPTDEAKFKAWGERQIQKELFDGYCAVTMQAANSRPLLSNVSARAALWINQIIRADTEQRLDRAVRKYEGFVREQLVHQAREIVKGGQDE